jgi:dinuclear metal center YbgI/SA1388 family protein
MIRVGDIARIIEENYPLHFALPGDNCGLQAGSLGDPVRRVLVALDPTREAVRRAVRVGASLLVTHHPLFYEALKSVDPTTAVGGAAAAALAEGVSIYSAHTNLDAAPEGLARELARRVGIANTVFFAAPAPENFYKIVVFVPETDLARVYRAISDAGGGVIGSYDSCAFATRGEGMYRPLADARPVVGRPGKREKVPEIRLEMVLAEQACEKAVLAMKAAHPYEEAAYDLIPLRGPARGGLGCTGEVTPQSFRSFAREAARRFGSIARISGEPPAKVTKVAVVPGSGGGYVGEASRMGAQVLVTGEIRYHQMLEAEHLGVGVVELGHDRSEMPAVDLMAKAIRKGLPRRGGGTAVHTYRRPGAAKYLAAGAVKRKPQAEKG